jgi:hypothetical protein
MGLIFFEAKRESDRISGFPPQGDWIVWKGRQARRFRFLPSPKPRRVSMKGFDDGGTIMSSEKLDKRLVEEIQARREGWSTSGKSQKALAREQFDVTIEFVQPPSIPTGMQRQQALEEIQRQVEQIQAGVVTTLHAWGITNFQRQILSNSIAVTLTLDQIQEIAKRDDVRIIRLVKPERVTT